MPCVRHSLPVCPTLRSVTGNLRLLARSRRQEGVTKLHLALMTGAACVCDEGGGAGLPCAGPAVEGHTAACSSAPTKPITRCCVQASRTILCWQPTAACAAALPSRWLRRATARTWMLLALPPAAAAALLRQQPCRVWAAARPAAPLRQHCRRPSRRRRSKRWQRLQQRRRRNRRRHLRRRLPAPCTSLRSTRRQQRTWPGTWQRSAGPTALAISQSPRRCARRGLAAAQSSCHPALLPPTPLAFCCARPASCCPCCACKCSGTCGSAPRPLPTCAELE